MSGPVGAGGLSNGNVSLKPQKETGFTGRLGIGYAYAFPAHNYSNTSPDRNFNLAGLLTYNLGSQKLKENGIEFSGEAFDRRNNADTTWTTKLKDAMELRVQPGYYVVPLRTLIYGTVGYAQAKLETSGQNIQINSSNNAGDGTVSLGGNKNLNGWVLGFGAKYSPIAKFYVGFDYSHISYKGKS